LKYKVRVPHRWGMLDITVSASSPLKAATKARNKGMKLARKLCGDRLFGPLKYTVIRQDDLSYFWVFNEYLQQVGSHEGCE